MKKNIVIIACLLALPMRGMEPQQKKLQPYTIVVHNTQIVLKNSPLYTVDKTVGIVGVGRNWQRKLQKPNFGDNKYIGSTECLSNQDELSLLSFTGTATYDSYIIGQELWKQAQCHPIDNLILRVVEPDITKKRIIKLNNTIGIIRFNAVLIKKR